MESKLEREVRLLKAYATVATLVFAVLILSAFATQRRKPKFQEIDVERINIVEKNGAIRLVISNEERSPGPIERGKPFGYPGGSRAGMIFYNDEGTEDGGLIFSGKRENGKVTAVGSLTFDQYEQDQTIALQYVDDNGKRRAGLAINDYPTSITGLELAEKWKTLERMPEGPAKTEERQRLQQYRSKLRMYAGRGRDGNSLVQLSDAEGRPRLQLVVDPDGAARIEFLDESGQVTSRLPAPINKQP
ncbi:MAG TPA: hypothetical protein VF173_12575 [Thermoanaerobaculia bacterium]|nr:hypothetical protein [Thermoanaerobaculia bacterium]